jgi:hypothetical protein
MNDLYDFDKKVWRDSIPDLADKIDLLDTRSRPMYPRRGIAIGGRAARWGAPLGFDAIAEEARARFRDLGWLVVDAEEFFSDLQFGDEDTWHPLSTDHNRQETSDFLIAMKQCLVHIWVSPEAKTHISALAREVTPTIEFLP